MNHQSPHRSSPVLEPPAESDRLIIGKMTTAFGVKGWIKVRAHTEHCENVFDLQPWWITMGGQCRMLVLEEGRRQGKYLIAKFKGIDDRTAIEPLQQHDIFIHRTQLPPLEEGDYYWTDLIGLRVCSVGDQDLGYVVRLMETGSNDVLVVSPDTCSVDDRERLVPYLVGDVVKTVDLRDRRIIVDWDLDF